MLDTVNICQQNEKEACTTVCSNHPVMGRCFLGKLPLVTGSDMCNSFGSINGGVSGINTSKIGKKQSPEEETYVFSRTSTEKDIAAAAKLYVK